jgi:hypothetical protein
MNHDIAQSNLNVFLPDGSPVPVLSLVKQEYLLLIFLRHLS